MKKLILTAALWLSPAAALAAWPSPTYQGMTLLGTATAPTAAPLTNNGQLSTTGYTDSAVGVEKARAQGAESTNATAISTETARAQAAEALRLPLAGGTMTGALGVPSVALSGGGSIGDVSGMSVLPNGAGTPNAIALAMQAAQSGMLLDTFKRGVDADDTASLTRAVAAGVPILLGPRTYTINNFSTGAVSSFVLRGIPGRSVIQRTSASGSQFFDVGASTVYIDGVTFDMNSGSVSANQWGVFLYAAGQNVQITRSVFKNNSGTLGSCLNLLSTGPAAGGWFYLNDDEVANCTNKGEFLGSVSNGVVSQQYIHDNPGTAGIYAGSYLTASSTNYLTNVQFVDNRFVRDGSGLQIGGYGPPYVFGTPSATNSSSADNHFQDVSGDALSLQGDKLWSTGDKFFQSSSTVLVNTAIDCNSRYQHIVGDTINYVGASYGIDCGGSVDADVEDNTISMTSGSALDVGGNQNPNVENNTLWLSGTAIGALVYATETDGSGVPFPTVMSGLNFTNNVVNISGTSALGIDLLDDACGYPGATPCLIKLDKFNGTSSEAPFQDITYKGSSSSLELGENTHNNSSTSYIGPNGNTDIIFDNVYDTIIDPNAAATVRSIASAYVNSYGPGGSILYVYPSAGGTGYSSATTLAAAGTGCTGWTGTPLISQGVIVGVRTTAIGSGCTGTATVAATDSGGGAGATFVVGQHAALPQYRKLEFISAGDILRASGAYIALASQNSSLQLAKDMPIYLDAIQGGSYWRVSGYNLATYAVGGVPACNSNSNGTFINVTGSTTGKWQARCNGTNWIWPDGTTVSN